MLAAVASAGAAITARHVAGAAVPLARLMSTAVHARRVAQSEPEYEKVPEAANLEVLQRLSNGSLPHHQLEKEVDPLSAVKLRRAHISESLDNAESLESLPVSNFDTKHFYESVHGTNCECVIGYVPLPVGVVGPLSVDGKEYRVPMATTEGALIASTNRGARAIQLSGGAKSAVLADGMTRAPVVVMPSAVEAAEVKHWVEDPERLEYLRSVFSTTTRYGSLQNVAATVAGRNVYLRFKCSTGSAMGMNMVGKGINTVVHDIMNKFPAMRLVSLSGNMCVDKKPSAINWIQGRGKSVVAETVLKGDIVRDVLKTSVDAMAELNVTKNLVGSAMAGSIGGFNAHASNIVTACFLATGQDPAQNVESSNCIVLMDKVNDGEDLHVSVTMPSLEVGTIGGGTSLPAQAACLEMMGLKSQEANPGDNARMLARIFASTVMAGEISLAAALTSGHLISAHMALNRK